MNQRKAGVLLSYLATGIHSVIQLVYVPLLLYYLSKEQYGIYQLMGSLIAYLAIMDFGLANTTTRYLSQAYAVNDEISAKRIISTSHTLYLFFALIVVLLGGIFYAFIPKLYGSTLGAADLLIAKQIFLIMLFNIAVTVPANIFVATINAYEHFIFIRGINLLKIILQPLIVWAILAWKASVLNLVLTQTIFNIITILINYIYCRTKLNISFPFNMSDRELMGELTGFSFFVFLHSVMDMIFWRLGQLVLGALIGAAAVANYAIAMQLAIFTILLPTNMSSVFLPQLSAITSKTKDMTQINDIFCKLGRLQYMFIMLLLIGFAFLGKTFIMLWIGPGYNVCYYITLMFIAAYVLDVSQNIGNPILQAMKKHAFRAYVYVTMSLLDIILCIILAKRYGEIGCAVATVICLIIGSGFAINWYYARIGIDLKRFFYNLFSISKGIILSLVLIIGLFYIWPVKNTWESLFFHGLIMSSIYCILIWEMAFNRYEKDLIIKPLCKMRTICKKIIRI